MPKIPDLLQLVGGEDRHHERAGGPPQHDPSDPEVGRPQIRVERPGDAFGLLGLAAGEILPVADGPAGDTVEREPPQGEPVDIPIDEGEQGLLAAGDVPGEIRVEERRGGVERQTGRRVLADGQEPVELEHLLLAGVLDAIVEPDEEELADHECGQHGRRGQQEDHDGEDLGADAPGSNEPATATPHQRLLSFRRRGDRRGRSVRELRRPDDPFSPSGRARRHRQGLRLRLKGVMLRATMIHVDVSAELRRSKKRAARRPGLGPPSSVALFPLSRT
jgi:hypothetical protein